MSQRVRRSRVRGPVRNALRTASPALAAVVISAAGLRAQQAPEGAVVEEGTFDVRGTPVRVQHGSFIVPANRASGTSQQLTLRFVRFPSTAAEPGAPIVFLAGGPGDAATRAFGGMPMTFLDELRAIADVIAFDQRGTGTSEPLDPRCPPGAPLPRDRPADPAERSARLRQRLEACLVDAARRGIDVMGLTTVESADDLEDLRRALNADALSLLAGSYGTHLALATARRHPAAVHRMVLLGVEGPDHTLKLPARVDEVVARIAASRRSTLVDEIRTLRARLAAAPAHHALPGGQVIVLGEWDLQRWIAGSLDTRREIAAMVDGVAAMLEGDLTGLARWALRDRMPRPLDLMNLAMDCASFASAPRLRRIAEEATGALLGDAINHPLREMCAVRGLPRLPDGFRAPVRSDVPALLVAGTLDGRTPVANAHDVAEGLPRARTLVVDGVSHDLFQDATVLDEVLRFLRH